jgi:hypothetical protein
MDHPRIYHRPLGHNPTSAGGIPVLARAALRLDVDIATDLPKGLRRLSTNRAGAAHPQLNQ